MPTPTQWAAARARQTLSAALRRAFVAMGYLEIETPCLVPTPGLEPHIDPFEVPFVPQTDVGARRTLALHTSPEYAMKRLLADPGCPPLFQLCKTFRNGEVSGHHNPEFTMLEFYRPHADYGAIMGDLERVLAAGEQAVAPGLGLFSKTPFERLTVRDALVRYADLDLRAHADGPSLKRAADARGVYTGTSTSFDDVFFHVFLERVERQLGRERPTFLVEYPASMASLARLKPGDPTVAERVELYVQGVELANGFSELTDASEQRRRLVEEQGLRRALGRPVYPLDERFLEAVGRMPPSAGIAVGFDRVLMLLLRHTHIADVLLFPAKDFV
ncbi:MAG: EF-P lysine aminoacylase GenX [Myxococcaceae bacterium]|jgi:lysyl-tRNA synthetase class 2|nr:EF-P lysine aminoacylase GenX [Myxococcaceae bacterium]